ncbi:MAG: regulatory protein RecX [Ferruginibacter sp.]
MMKQKNIGVDAAIQKIAHYCAYQERTHQETREKLYSFGLYPNEVEEIIGRLIEENYLNEERFALAYAGGKFRINQWGKMKIKYSLQQKRVSAACIATALNSLDDEAYQVQLNKLAETKWVLLKKEKNIFSRKKKLFSYLQQKGYESFLIQDWLSKIIKQ